MPAFGGRWVRSGQAQSTAVRIRTRMYSRTCGLLFDHGPRSAMKPTERSASVGPPARSPLR